MELFDINLLETAVEKHYIGLGQRLRNFKLVYHGLISPDSVSYPIIQLDYQGLNSVKCPTVSGGRWFQGVDWRICNQNQNFDLHLRGQKVNFLTDIYHTNLFNILWLILIFVEALKCGFNIYYLSKNEYEIDLTKFKIKHLEKYKKIISVS